MSVWQVSTQTQPLRVRESPSLSAPVKTTLDIGTQVTAGSSGKTEYVAGSADGTTGNWVHVEAPVEGWMYSGGGYLTCLEGDPEPEKEEATFTENNATPEVVEQTSTGDDNANYSKFFVKYLRALGSPPRLNSQADPIFYQCGKEYKESMYNFIGRTSAETLYTAPSILSICPGKVKYLPSFTNDKKESITEKIVDALSGLDGSERLSGGSDKLTGSLYEFKSAYTEYIKVVNMLCRVSATLIGLGKTNMPGTSIPLNKYDYAYYTTEKAVSVIEAESVKGIKGIFGQFGAEFANALDNAVQDDSYVHFYIQQNGTSVNESEQNDTEQSELDQLLNGGTLDSTVRNMNFLTGGAVDDPTMSEDLQALISSAGDGWAGSFANIVGNYYHGGRIVVPEMLSTCTYTKSISAEFNFHSIYGDKLSIFLRCIVPSCFAFAFAFPQQISENMYTYPFLCRVHQPGWFNTDLAVVSGFQITAGGDDDTCWSADGLATSYKVSFDITPLYNKMMTMTTDHQLNAMMNTPMLEYLGNMCGVDLQMNQIENKISILSSLAEGEFDKFTKLGGTLATALTEPFRKISSF